MAEKPLLPAYLIDGEDTLKRETVLKRLRLRLSALGDLDFNSDTFDGATAEGRAIVAACNTMPFASEKRLVVVAGADALAKAEAEAVAEYLKQPAEFCVLALVSAKLPKNSRLYKAVAAIDKTAVISCDPVKEKELPARVRDMAPAYGFTLDFAAAQLLVELVGDNTVRIDAELKKIGLAHTGSQPVTAAQVDALVVRTAEAKPWTLTDAFACRDAAKCVDALSKLDRSPYQLIASCTNTVRELLVARALGQRGETDPKALMDALGAKGGSPYRYKMIFQHARGWSSQELRCALSTAREAERAMKSGANPDAAFLEWMIATVSRHAS